MSPVTGELTEAVSVETHLVVELGLGWCSLVSHL